jgi:predicted RNA methylase
LIIEEVKRLSARYRIAIKYHPLQPQSEINEYELLLKDSNIKIFDKAKNIYDCILESKVIISHVSTVLEEALSLGKLSATIVTQNLPQGIHSMTDNFYLSDVIIPTSISGLSNLLDAVVFKNDLPEITNRSLHRFQFEIYEANYYSNILKLIRNGTD